MVIEVKGRIYRSGTIGKGKMAGMKYYNLLIPRPDGMADTLTLFSEREHKVGTEISVLANAYVQTATEVYPAPQRGE